MATRHRLDSSSGITVTGSPAVTSVTSSSMTTRQFDSASDYTLSRCLFANRVLRVPSDKFSRDEAAYVNGATLEVDGGLVVGRVKA